MRQADVFLQGGEGDKWLDRNRDQLGLKDPVTDMIEHIGIKPKRVLEIGCSNGWRLAMLRAMYDCEVFGVEPSMKACIEAADRRVPVWQMTASTLPEMGQKFDLIIYGFCLYLTDPAEWLQIAAEGDRALAPDGHLIVHDFVAPEGFPFVRKYEHLQGLLAYHVDFAKLWLAHPAYTLLSQTYGVDEMVSLLRKRATGYIEMQP